MQSSALIVKFAGALLCAVLAAAGALGSSGCDSEPYCINCGANADGDGGAGGFDAGSEPADANTVDAGPQADACSNSGVEVCDGIDNDCDGEIDEGSLDGVGVVCSTDTGECVAGVTECISGAIVCGGGAVLPVPELCDGKDNDCNGEDDNGDPEGGGICGDDTGECKSGIKHCVSGVVECVGDLGPDPAGELCDGKDNDCDGMFDEGIADQGACGPAEGDTGECQAGTMSCVGGQFQCVGAVYPQIEQCDNLDHDCVGGNLNGFDLTSDATRCGSCSNDCTDDFVADDHVQTVACVASSCQVAACEEDYFDNDLGLAGGYANGCEFNCTTFKGPAELCNNEDDDCDGSVDEVADLTTPQICDVMGMNCHDVCDIAGTLCESGVSQCTGGAWECAGWPAEVETDGSGKLVVEESICDDLDNDCDGNVDESFPSKDEDCVDSGLGICQRSGTWDCNGAKDALECTNLSPVVTAGTEVCNNLDDNCDGTVDDGFLDGAESDWVAIGGGVEIFAYEASRPDSDNGSAGAVGDTHVCSKADTLPWTGLTQPEAEAVCTSIGARLCTEPEWQRACKAQDSFEQGAGPEFLVVMEAEDYHDVTQGSDHSWKLNAYTGHSGNSAMWAWPNVNQTYAGNTGPHMDYYVNFNQAGTHYVWVRGLDWQGNNFDDIVHVGLDGAIPTTGTRVGRYPGTGVWTWMGTQTSGGIVSIDVPSAGLHTFNIFWADEAVIIDKIIITTDLTYTPTGVGPNNPLCEYSYASACTSYSANTCNGNDFDTDTIAAGDQDEILATGEMTACYADWAAAGKVFDMSGNVKEWTAARSADNNPFRGGASNSAAGGTSCALDFGVVDDDFSFPNVGFRCCR